VKSARKKKYLYVSIRRQQALPCLGDADRVCFANRSIPALQDKNPSAPIAKRRKHLPYPLFLLSSPPQKKSYKKENADRRFRTLRSATVAADGSRRLLKKAGENFNLEQVFSVCLF
jgi:hypothetical protein